MTKADRLIAKYNWRYTIALIVIAAGLTLSFMMLDWQYRDQKSKANVLNIAGEQRMLSQKISFIAISIINQQHSGISKNELLQWLEESANKMDANQRQLNKQLAYFDVKASDEIRRIYTGDNQLNQRVSRYTETAQKLVKGQLLSQTEKVLFLPLSTNQLLADLHQVVTLFEQSTKQELAKIQQLSLAFWLIGIISILLIGLMIFKPMKAWLSKAYNNIINERNRAADFQQAVNEHSIVMHIDKNKRLKFYNEKFSKVYGYDQNELLGEPINVLRNPQFGDAFETFVIKSLESKSVWRGESCNIAKNGFVFTNTGSHRAKHYNGRTNGLFAFSCPIVVSGPCPQYTM